MFDWLLFALDVLFSDVIIGAPYEGHNYSGAVYVYHGTKNGIEHKYRQVKYIGDWEVQAIHFNYCHVLSESEVEQRTKNIQINWY